MEVKNIGENLCIIYQDMCHSLTTNLFENLMFHGNMSYNGSKKFYARINF